VPADLKFIVEEFGKETSAYFCNFVQIYDLYLDFYGFIGRNFSPSWMHLVMRGVIGVDLKTDVVSCTLILQHYVSIRKRIRFSPAIYELDGVLHTLPKKFKIAIGRESLPVDTVFND
jgi:hypothetical protein